MIRVTAGRGRNSKSVTDSGGSGRRVVCLPSLSASLYGVAVDIAPGDRTTRASRAHRSHLAIRARGSHRFLVGSHTVNPTPEEAT